VLSPAWLLGFCEEKTGEGVEREIQLDGAMHQEELIIQTKSQ
jgi:hypothetical protein